jgi:hypothetical protein
MISKGDSAVVVPVAELDSLSVIHRRLNHDHPTLFELATRADWELQLFLCQDGVTVLPVKVVIIDFFFLLLTL